MCLTNAPPPTDLTLSRLHGYLAIREAMLAPIPGEDDLAGALKAVQLAEIRAIRETFFPEPDSKNAG